MSIKRNIGTEVRERFLSSYILLSRSQKMYLPIKHIFVIVSIVASNISIIIICTYILWYNVMKFFQVWYFILQYLNSVSERGMSLVECLAFLFQLSFSQLGKVRTINIHTKETRFLDSFNVTKLVQITNLIVSVWRYQ